MRAFGCEVCGAELFFENSVCVRCGSAVGYSREHGTLVAVTADRPICANLNRCGCNWIADPASVLGLCFSCRLTRTRPADADAVGLAQYWVAEAAKRRLIFGLDELELPIMISDGFAGLAFDLLSSTQGKIITGHLNGIITLDLAESNDSHREALRQSMDEPYRTVLGHFRHEIGHYYCQLLALTPDRRDEFRTLFGDETLSYEEALQRHYASRELASSGRASSSARTRPCIRSRISRRCSATSCTSPTRCRRRGSSGCCRNRISATTSSRHAGTARKLRKSLLERPMAEVVGETWLPVSKGLNQINRSMGKPDLYPFVLRTAGDRKAGVRCGSSRRCRAVP